MSSPSPWLRALHVALATVAAGASLASLIGFAGSLWWVLDLFAHFRVQYAAVLLACAAGLLAIRRWWSAALCAPLLALNVALLAPLYLGVPAPAADGAARLRVVSFNVNGGNRRHDDILGWIREQEPDVVVLSELRPELFDRARDRMPGYEIVSEARADNFGIAAFVRAPLVEARIVHPGGGAFPAVEIVVEREGARFAILGLHPPPPVSGDASLRRDAILEAAAAWARDRDVPAAVVGDLNTTPWGRAFSRLLDGGLESSQRGFGYQASWPAGVWPLAIPIDHCLHAPSLTTLERRVGPALGSDHRPLSLTLAPRR